MHLLKGPIPLKWKLKTNLTGIEKNEKNHQIMGTMSSALLDALPA